MSAHSTTRPARRKVTIGLQSRAAYGALARAVNKLAMYPFCKIEKRYLGCQAGLDVIREAIMSVNGPVQFIGGGQWALLDSDEGGLAARTLQQIERVDPVKAETQEVETNGKLVEPPFYFELYEEA